VQAFPAFHSFPLRRFFFSPQSLLPISQAAVNRDASREGQLNNNKKTSTTKNKNKNRKMKLHSALHPVYTTVIILKLISSRYMYTKPML